MTHPLDAQQPFETYATHADGSVCTCVYSSAEWWLKHWTRTRGYTPWQQGPGWRRLSCEQLLDEARKVIEECQ